MRKRVLVSVIVLVLIGCGKRQPVAVGDARSDAAPATCVDAIRDAKASKDFGWQEDRDVLDVDGDGEPECVLRGCYSANCEVLVYAREGTRVRRIAEMTVSFVSRPTCVTDAPRTKGFCQLAVDVQMIHGEMQEYFYSYDGTRYVENGHGRMIPGPP